MKKKVILIVTAIMALTLTTALAACGVSEKSKETSGDMTLDTAYSLAVENGFQGTMSDYLEYIKGDSAYEIAVKNGEFEGTEKEWLNSLQGKDGMDGKSASITAGDLYDEAVARGFEGTYFDFLQQYLTVNTDSTIKTKALLSSVSVYCSFEIPYNTLTSNGYQTGTQIGITAGSGFIYSLNKEEGSAYIVTNYHLVYNVDYGISKDIFVYLYGSEIIGKELYTEEYVKQFNVTGPDYTGMGISATFVGGSQHYDIAVLYIDGSELIKNSDATSVEFADSNELFVSQTAYAVGNAESEGISVTKGVVSVDSENLQMIVADNSETANFRVFRIDTAINLGNSGGGIFDDEGRLIGIVKAKTTISTVENIGYALPSNVIKYITENILYYKNNSINKDFDVQKCMLGITVSSRESSAVLDKDTGKLKIKERVMINDVQQDGLADGSLQSGDILLSAKIHHTTDEEGYYEEHEINRTFIIVDLMLTMRVGDKLILQYERTNDDGVVEVKESEFLMTEQCIKSVS